MSLILRVDRAGRVFLPKALQHLHLSPGGRLEAVVKGEGVVLRPQRTVRPPRRKDGIWVFASCGPMSAEQTEETLRRVREERDRRSYVRVPA